MRPGLPISVLALCVLALLPGHAEGQPRGGPARGRPPVRLGAPPKSAKDRPLERLRRMTPAERQRALQDVPPERRRKIERRLEEFDQLSPQERDRFERFNGMPRERQDAVRRAFGGMNHLPPGRRQAVRRELQQLRVLPETERRARLASPDFRDRFDSRERDIIEQLSEVVPK